MQQPIQIARYIALVTAQAVAPAVVKSWFRTVKETIPGGLLLTLSASDDKGMPQSVCLVHREMGERHLYMIPLTRDLEEAEAEGVVQAFMGANPEDDYEIEISALHAPETEEAPSVEVEKARYLELCNAWARRQHETWMASRLDQGWRYGPEMSMTARTNPLLRPWAELSDQFKIPNLEEPQALLDLLNDQGYAVISRDELEAMMALMRKNGLKESVDLTATTEEDPDETDTAGEEIEEGLFGSKSKAAVPADRINRATMGTDDREAARNWMSGPSPARRSLAQDFQDDGASRTKPAAAAPAARAPAKPAFGRRA